MALRNKIYEPDLQSDRAKNIQGDVIFIDDAESGRKGYYCLGCGKEMQAAIQRKNPNYKSYFSHVPVDKSKGEKPCVFSNREYREILASNILQRLKRIKVPAILKYPHKGNDEYPVQLQAARFIDAHSVKSEITFYEDEEGNVDWGKNPDIEDRYLLMRPDVVFFDINEKPILFIELVVTHKIDDEKRIKLRRLGIDTVSVRVPKSSDQDIEKAFNITKHTKWEYSEEEANTAYTQVAKRTSERVLEFDEDQRRVFREGYNCRKSRIANTIRSIRKNLESESYRRTQHEFESEISRIENATEAEKSGLEQMENRFDAQVYSQFAGEFEQLAIEKNKLEREEKEFQEYCGDLEGRYLGKKSEVEGEGKLLDKTTSEVSRESESKEEIRKRFREEEISEQSHFESARGRLQKGIKHNSPELPRGIKTLLERRRFGDDFKNLQRQEKRYQGARKFFNSGTWKTR
ncbi:hypothetical protein [Dokdonia donghaensis]|uniref:Competence protein n=1 Tax=Dokdonia donghaensis DSW-1 TaxID=1300343 RepID=A0A0A2GRS3_9FLAO|nr:hypothetical protein [Dokdonia donghaensis]ANH60734.1 hypothetical protein I597_1832 [Dokdonia donghaensis DSW-1]KGO05994.1 hypothetical protein NV36_03480 [Dokdonia donghaensis DSW-1]